MSLEVLLSFIGFCLVASGTPGPNNIMLLTSGVNFGFVRTIPHIIGIPSGFAMLLLAIGLGLGQVFEFFPSAYILLKILGGSYMIYLAYKIATSGLMEIEDGKIGEAAAKPMSFMQAFLFQWVNPKAWVMGITAMATFTQPEQYYRSVMIICLVFTALNFPVVSLWALSGTGLRRLLANDKAITWFNRMMALLLVASLWPMPR